MKFKLSAWLFLPLVTILFIGVAIWVTQKPANAAGPTNTLGTPVSFTQPSGVPAIPVSPSAAQTAAATGKPAIQIKDINSYVNSQTKIFNTTITGTINISSTQLATGSQAAKILNANLAIEAGRLYYVVILNNQGTFYGSSAGQIVQTNKVFEVFDAFTGNLMTTGGIN